MIATPGAARTSDGVACIVQGKLLAGGMVAEAGLVAQPKAPKVQVAAAA